MATVVVMIGVVVVDVVIAVFILAISSVIIIDTPGVVVASLFIVGVHASVLLSLMFAFAISNISLFLLKTTNALFRVIVTIGFPYYSISDATPARRIKCLYFSCLWRSR